MKIYMKKGQFKNKNILTPAVTRSSDKIESIVRMCPRYVWRSENRIPEI